MEEALRRKEDYDVILFAGSLYLIGQIRGMLRRRQQKPERGHLFFMRLALTRRNARSGTKKKERSNENCMRTTNEYERWHNFCKTV